ncbi:MAG: hypothetical protein NW217_02225 [Hyphomicrobiaceae bacterium]|nr:hypothetical protein [Hyphomicrobiaceae bacterium]
MSLKSLRNGRAQPRTKPVSLRLALRDIEQLQARAFTVSGSVTGVARDLILTGLAGGDNKSLADRLTLIERRLIAIEAFAREQVEWASRTEVGAQDLRTKFTALLTALSTDEGGR